MGFADWVKILASGGFGVVITLIANAYRAWSEMGSERKDKPITRWRDLLTHAEKEIRQAKAEAEYHENTTDYWRNKAGVLEYICLQRGIPIPDFGPVPKPPVDKVEMGGP